MAGRNRGSESPPLSKDIQGHIAPATRAAPSRTPDTAQAALSAIVSSVSGDPSLLTVAQALLALEGDSPTTQVRGGTDLPFRTESPQNPTKQKDDTGAGPSRGYQPPHHASKRTRATQSGDENHQAVTALARSRTRGPPASWQCARHDELSEARQSEGIGYDVNVGHRRGCKRRAAPESSAGADFLSGEGAGSDPSSVTDARSSEVMTGGTAQRGTSRGDAAPGSASRAGGSTAGAG
jgi:hypothetical protein